MLAGGVTASSVLPLPIVAQQATTNFNQALATLNYTVNPQGLATTVSTEISSDGGSSWSSPLTTHSGLNQLSSQTLYHNRTGLSVGTAYRVRVTASNAKGVTVSQSSTANFTTWSLLTYLKTTSGSFTVSVPSVTPTGGSAIAPTIYEMLIYAGGGGANYGGGGGGGYRIFSSHTSSVAGTQNVTGTVGAGGAGGDGGVGVGNAGSGGTSSINIGATSWSATGGAAGRHVGACGNPSGTGGTSGFGSNAATGGGNNSYGYYYFTGSYVQYCCAYGSYCCGGYDKNNNCQGWCTDYNNCTQYCNDTNQPIYAWNCGYYAGGGGGGTDGGGSNSTGGSGSSHVGGAGGAGGGAYGLRGGNGGGGGGTQGTGANGSVAAGSGPIVGTGGQGWFGAGVAGGVTFKYYGPA